MQYCLSSTGKSCSRPTWFRLGARFGCPRTWRCRSICLVLSSFQTSYWIELDHTSHLAKLTEQMHSNFCPQVLEFCVVQSPMDHSGEDADFACWKRQSWRDHDGLVIGTQRSAERNPPWLVPITRYQLAALGKLHSVTWCTLTRISRNSSTPCSSYPFIRSCTHESRCSVEQPSLGPWCSVQYQPELCECNFPVGINTSPFETQARWNWKRASSSSISAFSIQKYGWYPHNHVQRGGNRSCNFRDWVWVEYFAWNRRHKRWWTCPENIDYLSVNLDSVLD